MGSRKIEGVIAYLPYLVSLAILIAAIVLFFAAARGDYTSFGFAQMLLRILAALPLLLSAVLIHFLKLNEATAMIPPVFPATGLIVLLSGVLEILGAIGLFVPRVRKAAALSIAILMVAVFPANIYVAGLTFGGLRMPSVPVRLSMQIVYIWIVLLAGYGLPSFRRTKALP
jgi:uncharacterized membrane protein